AHAAIEKPRQVVGTSWYVDGNPNIRHAFIWQSGAINDLNSLIPSDIDLLMTCAAAIAQDGRIVGTATSTDGIVAVLLTPGKPPLGDLDGDCQVGVFDLFLLLAKWGQTDSDADLDDDGVVGILDLLTLLANWT
ncbi:MAG: hypothetical protein O7D97_05720, partial [Planctomycetota bacterium]|nr:hypothetical protein [Planctomycetota bacterium]